MPGERARQPETPTRVDMPAREEAPLSHRKTESLEATRRTNVEPAAPERPRGRELREIVALPPLEIGISAEAKGRARTSDQGVMALTIGGERENEVEQTLRKAYLEQQFQNLQQDWQVEQAKMGLQGQVATQVESGDVTSRAETAAYNTMLHSFAEAEESYIRMHLDVLGKEPAELPTSIRALAYETQLTPETLYRMPEGEASEFQMPVGGGLSGGTERQDLDALTEELQGLVKEVQDGKKSPEDFEQAARALKDDPRYDKMEPDRRALLAERLRSPGAPSLEDLASVPPGHPSKTEERKAVRDEIAFMAKQFRSENGIDIMGLQEYASGIWKESGVAELPATEKLAVYKELAGEEPFKSSPDMLPFLFPAGYRPPDKLLGSIREAKLLPEQGALVGKLYRTVANAERQGRVGIERAYLGLKSEEDFKQLSSEAKIVLFERLKRDNLSTGNYIKDLSLLRERHLIVEMGNETTGQVYVRKKNGRTENVTKKLAYAGTGIKRTRLDLDPQDTIVLMEPEKNPLDDSSMDMSSPIENASSSTVAKAGDIAKRLGIKGIVIRVPKEG